ncbi:SPRY-domain-containing protein [Hesseltinella vesiculosa]|uniref:SPRY-domain-containing protein n=1 Tax=Hesseltinella vesiculosa TaxID=101127 RepID=A0A1X2G420_9FUNG|nr:SPRY-domain-containing protein [Hesseltinella vesiculosa]
MDYLNENYAWIFIVGTVVFVSVVVILLCFTKVTGEHFFLSTIDDPEIAGDIEETPELLQMLSEDGRLSYERAKLYQARFPPESVRTDITLSQYVSIQEKGVSAFEFEWDTETNTVVSARTELQFFHGECCLQTNLPLPRTQDVYYWEAKMYELPRTTMVSVGVATKPYPNWRLPGWNKHSVGYFSHHGGKHFNNPFFHKSYGSPFQEGDVIGVGYRHRSGTIFYTKNGRKLEDACTGLRWNLFPTVGANGPCQIHVNLGQRGFVFVEANVKKWGLAPMQGTLAPPPAYGFESGSLLLERGGCLGHENSQQVSRSSTIVGSLFEDDDDDSNDHAPLIQYQHRLPRSTSVPHAHLQRPAFPAMLPSHSPPAYSSLPRSHGFTHYGSVDLSSPLISENP